MSHTHGDSAAFVSRGTAGTKLAGQWRVLAFTAAYLAVATPWAILSDNYEFLLYIGVVAVIVPLVGAVHLRVGLSTVLLWGFSFWGLLHMAGGLVAVPESWPISGRKPVLYSVWLIKERLKYDHLVHAYGFGITTWLCWQVLDRLLAAARRENPPTPTRPTFGLLSFCVAGGIGLGALNEVIEFAATLVVPETNVGGYVNTGWDLTANLIGSTLAALLIWIAGRWRADRGL